MHALAHLLHAAQVQWRRFFTFTWAFEELDQSWTARLVSGRFVSQRWAEMLVRANARASSAAAESLATELEERELLEQAGHGQAGAAVDGKKALQMHRQRHGNMLELSTEALGNRELQFVGRHLHTAILPLRELYLQSIPALVHSRMSIAQWHAKRAAGDWQETFKQILRSLTNEKLLRRCGAGVDMVSSQRGVSCIADEGGSVRPIPAAGAAGARAMGHPPHAAGVSNAADVLLCPPECAAEDIHTLRLASLARLVLCTVSSLAWYMWQFQACPPDAFAAILHPCPSERTRACRRLRRCWEAVLTLSQSLSAAHAPASHEKLMGDLYWAGTNPLVHESFDILERNKWRPTADVKHMVLDQWGGISDTKRVLEDVFAALKHAAARNKNSKLSRPHAYFEAHTCKVLSPSQDENDQTHEPAQTLVVSGASWQAPLLVPVSRMGDGMYMTPNAHKPNGLDIEVLRAGVARAAVPWKPAGPAALLRMAAASEYLMLEAVSQWRDAAAAWAGVLLGKLGVFLGIGRKQYFVSLGFHTWMTLACPLDALECDDGVFLYFRHAEAYSVVNHSCTEDSKFRGVAVELVSRSTCPRELTSAGIVWRVVSPPMPLVEYAILCKSMLSQPALAGICCALRLVVPKMPGDKGVTRLAYATALVRHVFPNEPNETHAAFIHGVMHGEKFSVGNQALGQAAVEVMDPQHKAEFEQVFDLAAGAAGAGIVEEDSAAADLLDKTAKPRVKNRGSGKQAGRGRKRKASRRGPAEDIPGHAPADAAVPVAPEGPEEEPGLASPDAAAEPVTGGRPPADTGGRPSTDTGPAPEAPGPVPKVPQGFVASGENTVPSGLGQQGSPSTFVKQVRLKFRQSGHMGPWRNFTPAGIKRLLPGKGDLPGVYIVWRRTTNTWESRYAGGVPVESCSKTWGGVRHGLTELEALMRCLHWLWTQHQQADSDTSAAHVMPTKQEVEIVLRELHAEWERRSVASCHGDTVPVAVQAPILNPAPTEAPSLQPLAGTGDSNNTTDNKNGPGMAAAASHAVAVGGVEDIPPAGASAVTSCVSVSAQAAQPPPRKKARKASRDALVVAPASIGLPSGSLGPVAVAGAGSSSAPVPARAADEEDLDMPLMALVSRGRGRGGPRGRGRGGRARSTTTLAHQPPPPAASSPTRPASPESPGQRLLSSSSSSSSSSS